MANIGELGLDIKANRDSLRKTDKTIRKELKSTRKGVEKDFDKGTKNISSSFKKLGGAIAGVFAVGQIIDFGKKLLGLGSDLEEITSKFNVVFNGSEKVRKKFEEVAVATNRSKLDLIQFGASIGDVLKPLGIAEEDVDDLAVSMSKLAIDVASFNNVSDAQVIQAFTSALTGETESLKTLGIVIKQADIKQKAYNLGLQQTGEELTRQQKALATYQLLLENSTDAQGDAIRTSESFANQLKGLQGAIKDTFAQAGQDVAQETSGILKSLSVFVTTYGSAIIKTIVQFGKTIGSVLIEAGKGFGGLFSFITSGTEKNRTDLQKFMFMFQKVFQIIGNGIKGFILLIKTLGKIVGTQLGNMIIQFYGLKNNIAEVWDFIKSSFIGTFDTLVDTAQLGVKTIGQVFVGMAEAIIGVFKGIATNVGVAVKKAGNVAIAGLNNTIGLINKVPGVNMDKILGFDDANFKPFELKITQNLDNLKNEFNDFGAGVKDNFGNAKKDFDEMSEAFKDTNELVQKNNKETTDEIKKDWTDFGTQIIVKNKAIEKSIDESGETAKKNAKKYDEGYFNILNILDKYKGKLNEGGKEQEALSEIAEQSIDNIKEQYDSWQDKIDDVNKKQEDLSKDTEKYNQRIKDSIREITKELQLNADGYEKAVSKIQSQATLDLANRSVEVNDELKKTKEEILRIEKEQEELRKKIKDTKKEEGDNEDRISRLKEQEEIKSNDIIELEKEKKRLLEEQQVIIDNTTEKQRKEAERKAGLSEAEAIKEQAQTEIEERERAFKKEKERLKRLKQINEAFLNEKEITEKEFNQVLDSEYFKQATKEEQRLIIELAREKMMLTKKKQAVISAEQEIYKAQVNLSNSATQIQLNNINTLKGEYQSLINSINSAIQRQRRLRAEENSGSFATGGYTGAGGRNEVAGVVHKGEWVAPKWMVNSMKPLFDSLESNRTSGFAGGGYTSNKSQTNNITVNSGMDIRGFMDYAKWKL